jgi:predicted kinase
MKGGFVQQAENDTQPTVILVSGMPASGKSTLAEQLAAALRIPFFTKDGIKELLFDAEDVGASEMDEETSERLGAQAMTVLYDIAQRMLDAGGSVLLEANFRAQLARTQIEPFLSQATVRQVACQLPMAQIVERFEERQEGDDRHPVHAEVDDVDQLVADLERKDYGPIPGIPTLLVDTSDGFDPPFEEIVRFCREG